MMLVRYMDAALRRAHYEIVEDDGTFYGEIPGFQGVYATAPTFEQTREELAEVLEEWVFLRIARQLPVPVLQALH